mgnify:FL=1
MCWYSMKAIYLLILAVFVAGCTYTGEVVSVDTPESSANEEIVDEPADSGEEIAADELPSEPAEEVSEPADVVYTGTVIKKSGLTSYTVRLDSTKDILMFTDETLFVGDVVEFRIDDGTANFIRVVEESPDRYDYKYN